MGKGTVVRPGKVRPFQCSDHYTSYMLMDHTNTGAKNLLINKGVLKAGGTMFPASKHGELGEEENNETYIILKGNCRFVMDDVWYELEAGDVIFIPAGVYHALDNSQGTEDLELLTVWGRVPEKGINGPYDGRLAAWGKSFMLADERK